MAQKDRSVRRVDERNDDLRIGGGQLLAPATASIVPPNLPSVPEPEDITIGSQTLLRTTLVPKVLLQLTWNPPSILIPELYEIQAAKDSAFTAGLLSFNTTTNSAVLELNTNTDYWIRVRAVVRGVYGDYGYPSSYPSVSVHTIGDTTPPGEVSSVVTDWTSDDLEFSWTNPTSDNFFDTRVRIYTADPGLGGTLMKEVFIPGSSGAISRYVFTLADNYQVTFGSPLTSVYYTIFARSIAHVLSPTGVSGTVSKTAPSKPTGVSDTWVLDDGTYDESVTISWTPVTGANNYLVIIDGLAKLTSVPFLTYNYTQNVADHRPTLTSGDHTLAYTVQARNGLAQTSPGASGTAINLPPLAANISLQTAPGFSSLYAYVTHPKDILDLHHYTFTLSSGGATVSRVISQTPEITFASLNGTYTLQVTATDMFGRTSNAVTVSGIVLDGLTIAQLRAETQYTDSIGTSPTTLAGLKDNNLVQSVVTYPSGITWLWDKAERPLLDRYRTITLTVSGAATNMPRVYFGLSTDDVTYTWYSGPLVATGTTGQNTTLTSYGSSEANAQTNGILITNINRFDLPSISEARFIKVGHRGNTHHFAEFYPRRLLQSDDIEAETIKGINIAAATITADKISVINLQAISAQMGNLHMDGVIDIDTAGGIYQGTGTFGTPTTGLKIFNSGGIGKLSTYRGGTEQVTFDTDGILKAGAGAVTLLASGIRLAARTVNPYTSVPAVANPVIWTLTGTPIASIEASQNLADATYNDMVILLTKGSSYARVWPFASSTDAQVNLGVHTSTEDGVLALDTNSVVITLSPSASTFLIQYASVTRLSLDDTEMLFEGLIGTTELHLWSTSSTDAHIYVFAGHPGVSFNGGGISSNWHASGGGSMAREDTGLGGAFLRLDSEIAVMSAITTGGTLLSNQTWGVSGGAAAIGFFGVTPVVRQTGGAATADATYSANEVSMINNMYTALRNYGLLT